jgi:hypothetical protein
MTLGTPPKAPEPSWEDVVDLAMQAMLPPPPVRLDGQACKLPPLLAHLDAATRGSLCVVNKLAHKLTRPLIPTGRAHVYFDAVCDVARATEHAETSLGYLLVDLTLQFSKYGAYKQRGDDLVSAFVARMGKRLEPLRDLAIVDPGRRASHATWEQVCRACPGLTRLSCDSFIGGMALALALPNVSELRVTGYTDLTSGWEAVLTNNGRDSMWSGLRTLRVEDSFGNVDAVLGVTRSCPVLETLCLSYVRNDEWDAEVVVAAREPRVRVINPRALKIYVGLATADTLLDMLSVLPNARYRGNVSVTTSSTAALCSLAARMADVKGLRGLAAGVHATELWSFFDGPSLELRMPPPDALPPSPHVKTLALDLEAVWHLVPDHAAFVATLARLYPKVTTLQVVVSVIEDGRDGGRNAFLIPTHFLGVDDDTGIPSHTPTDPKRTIDLVQRPDVLALLRAIEAAFPGLKRVALDWWPNHRAAESAREDMLGACARMGAGSRVQWHPLLRLGVHCFRARLR